MSRPRFIALLLALITLLVFLPASRYQFVNDDDPEYVTDNPFVKNGLNWTDFRWALTAFHSGNWHPLTWISHQIDCELFGLNAGAHHFVNLLIHAANVAILFILLWHLTGRLWPSALIAALFGWHPLHVESVAWISERKDVLSTFFALLSLLSYAANARERRRASFWLALVFFALGLQVALVLVAHDGRIFLRLVIELLEFSLDLRQMVALGLQLHIKGIDELLGRIGILQGALRVNHRNLELGKSRVGAQTDRHQAGNKQ